MVFRFLQANGTAYLALEYIEGQTLSQLLKREERLDPPRLQRLLHELLSGIDEIHNAGFVHRDIKPGNIMLREDGSAVLLDFGAARQAIGQRSRSITSILTPGYAPIEQYDQNANDTGPWTDLYALGMVAYRCISGIGDSELLDAVARVQLERKGDRDKDLAAALTLGRGQYDASLLTAIDWCIKVDEDQRPQSVTALKAALAGGEPPESNAPAPPPPNESADRTAAPVPKPPRPGKRRRGIAALALVIVAAGSGGHGGHGGTSPIVKEMLHWKDARCAVAVASYVGPYMAIMRKDTGQTRQTPERQRALLTGKTPGAG